MGKKQNNEKDPSLARKGEPRQKTKEGLEIPVPSKSEWLESLRKGAKPPKKKS
ncbi:MAG: hypothetical protein WD276_03025 [Actinomycetota bacterium]